MKITLDKSAYSSKFHNIIHSWDRYIIAYGGRGSGKTDSFYIKYLLSLFEPYYFRLAYINKEGSNIRDQQYAGFKRVAKRIGVSEYLKFYDGDYRILNPKNGNMLIPKGMDDPEKTKGLDDITAIWWDEINKGDIEDFRALNELLRSPMAMYLQFAMSFNPVSQDHWLRKTFFHEDDSHKLHPDYVGQTLLNHSTYNDNEFIDRKAYLQTLMDSAAGSLNRIRINIDGDWGIEQNNNPWLYSFNHDKHVKQVKFLPTYPIYLSFDFNKSPVTCTATQMSPDKGLPNSFLHVIDEFAGEINLKQLCANIKAKYHNSIFYVTGDASGGSGHLALEELGEKNMTFYTLIKRYLGLADRQMCINSKNLTFHDSRLLCNTMLHSYPNFYISPNCRTLIDDMAKATVDEKGQDPNKLKKDRDAYKMDMFDNWRYMLQTWFHEYSKRWLKVK
jgi:phage terminase large subunit